MVTKKILVECPIGIHLRPAGAMCEKAMSFSCKVTFEYGAGKTANAKSVISVLAAGVKCGEEINLICDGKDEEQAIEAVSECLINALKE